MISTNLHDQTDPNKPPVEGSIYPLCSRPLADISSFFTEGSLGQVDTLSDRVK